MVELLNATKPYINRFAGIRCSTRPDCINPDILQLLKSYGVTSIELGAQSMCDDVLEKNERGHTAKNVEDSSKLIKSYGFSLGLQMMTGLYGSNFQKDMFTAKAICDLKPDTVRVYPTITMKNTSLAELYYSGKYVPYNKEETIDINSKILDYFNQNNVNVIRFGLHYSDELVKNIVAGFYHPAFKELCESKIFYDSILNVLMKFKEGSYNIFVSEKSLSKAIGQKRENINKFLKLGYNVKFAVNSQLKNFEFTIEKK
jgi:histone acetyltransferase (RNA polymerase elongator complex component)